MATEPETIIYEIEDTKTGTIYEIEGPEGLGVSDLWGKIQQHQQSEQSAVPSGSPLAGPAPVPAEAAPQAAPKPTQASAPVTAPVKTRDPTAWEVQALKGGKMEATSERVDRPDIDAFADSLWRSGVRTPAEFNKALFEKFPDAVGQLRRLSASDVATINEYERYLKSIGQYDQNPLFGGTYFSTGKNDPEAPDSVFGNLAQGAVRSFYEAGNEYRGIAALGADVIGADETAEQWLKDYEDQQAALEYNYPLAVQSWEDIDSLGDAANYAAGILGTAPLELGTGVGAGLVGRKIGNKLVQKGLTDKAADRAMIGAVAADSIARNSGSTYGDTYAQTGEMAPGMSLAAGVASGLLDSILPAKLASKLSVPTDVAEEALKSRIIKSGIKDFNIEGATEAAQQFIQTLPADVINGDSPFTAEKLSQMFDAYLGGGIVGGTAGAASGGLTPSAPNTRKFNEQFPTEQLIVAPTAKRNTKAYREQITAAGQSVVDTVNTLTENWNNPPEVEVYRNFNQVKGVDNSAIGVYTAEGKVLLNTEAIIRNAERRGITPDEMVAAVTFHEALGHYGLEQKYAEGLDTVLDTIYQRGTDEFKDRVDSWMEANPTAYNQLTPDERLIRATEEVLAEMSEAEGLLPRGAMDTILDFIKNFARQIGLDLRYSTREVRGILGMAQREVTNGQKVLVDNTSSTNKFMYLGRNAKTADRLSLNRAMAADANGKPLPRNQTGWFKGPDNKWRFEISDKDSSLAYFKDEEKTRDLAEALSDATDLPASDFYYAISYRSGLDLLRDEKLTEYNGLRALGLEDVLDHEPLYKAYPELREVHVTSDPALNEEGNSRGAYYPSYNTIYINSKLNEEQARSVLLHEVQHWVQDKEGFASGGTPKAAINAATNDQILDLAHEQVMYLKEMGLKRDKAYISALTQLVKLEDVTGLRQALKSDEEASYFAYQRLFGEVEARDTQNRLSMDDYERSVKEPYESQSIDPRDYIFAGGTESAESYRPPETTSAGFKRPKIDDRFRQADRRKRQRTKAEAQERNKYMRPAEDPATLTGEDLVESNNAYLLLERISRNYQPTAVSPENIEQEALARGVSPSQVVRWVGKSPGELTKRLFMYDIAAEKLNNRLLNLKEEIQTKGLTEKNQAEYLKTLGTLEDLTSKIFQEQGELGRALSAIRRVNFTRKRVTSLKEVLAEYDLAALEDPETFFKLMREIEAQQAQNQIKTKDGKVVSILNTPRAIMSSMDLSAPLRQGLVFITKPEYWASFGKMFSFLGPSGRTNYDYLMRSIGKRETYPLMQAAKLSFSDLDGSLSSREEDFQSDLAKKIPVIGKGVAASEQAYAGFLNKLRADMFDKYIESLNKAGVELTEDVLLGLGRFINSATGRAQLPGGLQSMAPQLNTFFFSPRLIQSRINMLNPYFYYKLPAPVRKEAAKSMIGMGAVVALTLGIVANLFPEETEVELDWRSSDFGKIKMGDTRFDIGGGFNQYLTLAGRTYHWLRGEPAVKGADGDVNELGNEKFGQKTYLETVLKFFRNKLSPNTSFVVDYMDEKNAIGEPFEMDKAITDRVVPMFVGSVLDASKEYDPATAAAISVPGLFGVGVNTYTPTAIDKDEPLEAPESFEMEDLEDGENDDIVAKEGVVELKADARAMWGEILNEYYQQYLEEDIAASGKEWDSMTPEEQKAIIEVARSDARREAKKEMMIELGLD